MDTWAYQIYRNTGHIKLWITPDVIPSLKTHKSRKYLELWHDSTLTPLPSHLLWALPRKITTTEILFPFLGFSSALFVLPMAHGPLQDDISILSALILTALGTVLLNPYLAICSDFCIVSAFCLYSWNCLSPPFCNLYVS